MNNGNTNDRGKKNTNGWDVLIALVNGLYSLISIKKAIALGLIFVIIIQPIIFINKLPNDYNYSNVIINGYDYLSFIMKNDNVLVSVLITTILFLILIIIGLIIHTNRQRKEINRLAEDRSKLVHGFETGEYQHLKKHYSTKRRMQYD